MKVFYANGISINEGENFVLTFEFTLNGETEKICIVMSPTGIKTLLEILGKLENIPNKTWEINESFGKIEEHNYVR